MYNEESRQELVESFQSADWSSLPSELSYVIVPCMKYAIRVCAYGESMPIALTGEEMQELKECAETIYKMQQHQLLLDWITGKKRGQKRTPAKAMAEILLGIFDEFEARSATMKAEGYVGVLRVRLGLAPETQAYSRTSPLRNPSPAERENEPKCAR